MLSSVWHTLMPGGLSRRNLRPQQSPVGASEASVSVTAALELPQSSIVDTSINSLLTQDQIGGCAAEQCSSTATPCSCTGKSHTCSCTDDYCSCIRLSDGCNCTKCSCVCTLKDPSTSGLERVACAVDVPLAEFDQQQQLEVAQREPLHESISEDGQTLGPEATAGEQGASHGLEYTDENQSVFPSSPTSLLDLQTTMVEGHCGQREKQWQTGCLALTLADRSVTGRHSDSGYPEEWERIHSENGAYSGENLVGRPQMGDTTKTGVRERHPSMAGGSFAGWSSPPSEFEVVADSPLCDARRLLRLSQRQQLRGWDWACAGLTPAAAGNRPCNSSSAATSITATAAAAAAAVGGRAARRGSAVVQLLSSAVFSGVLLRGDSALHCESSDEASQGSGGDLRGADAAPATLSGWCGRWQLTSIDSPRGSLSSCWSEERRNDSAFSGPSASSSRSGRSLSRSRKRAAHTPPAEICCAEPFSSAAVSADPHKALRQPEALAVQGGSADPSFSTAKRAPEAEISCSATEVSAPAESGHSDASAIHLQTLFLHREGQCRRRLQGNDLRLNILITALPGVDVVSFCKQMFAEWQEDGRQHVSCGEEIIFRVPFASPFVEVSVIVPTTFASALPYCELRLLEKWGNSTAFQEGAIERRVHVCLFLIPQSTLPLATGVLALLKRLRAVACLLPLLVLRRPISRDQLSRDRGSLRLQLATSDLATLEEMLLPVQQDAGAHELAACARCRQQRTDEEARQPPEQYGCCFLTSRESNSREKCAESRMPETPESANFRESGGSGNSRSLTRKQLVKEECYKGLRRCSLDKSRLMLGSECSGTWSVKDPSLCRSAVHLPLVLLVSSDSSEDNEPVCTCWAGIDSSSTSVVTPVSLRRMLVEGSAMLLRERAEYGCFLPFLFQHQMQPNRTHKLRGLQQWEGEEEQQRQQQKHVQTLVDMRQGQIDTHPQAAMQLHLQRQLDELRQQLRKMQQQLLHLQERRFLNRLLREEAAAGLPFITSQSSLILPNSSTDNGEREELLSHMAQMGLVLAIMMGVGALLFSSIKRGNH